MPSPPANAIMLPSIAVGPNQPKAGGEAAASKPGHVYEKPFDAPGGLSTRTAPFAPSESRDRHATVPRSDHSMPWSAQPASALRTTWTPLPFHAASSISSIVTLAQRTVRPSGEKQGVHSLAPVLVSCRFG